MSATNTRKNVVIFGESGVGKSSIVNMLLGETVARVSDAAIGCTFDFQLYEHGEYNLYDTAGLSEGKHGTVDYKSAISGLIKLLKSLESGVNLLVFVMKKNRISKSLEENYKLFVETICMSAVPVVLIVTHCEQDLVMNKWWDDNRRYFEKTYKMKFEDAVCVCATRGEGMLPVFAEPLRARYDESKASVLACFEKHILPIGWRMKTWRHWFQTIFGKILTVLSFLGFLPKGFNAEPDYLAKLRQYFLDQGFDIETAVRLATDIYNSVP